MHFKYLLPWNQNCLSHSNSTCKIKTYCTINIHGHYLGQEWGNARIQLYLNSPTEKEAVTKAVISKHTLTPSCLFLFHINLWPELLSSNPERCKTQLSFFASVFHVVHVRQTSKIPVYSQFSQICTNSALLWLTLRVPNFFSHKRLKKTCSSNTARKQPSCYGMKGWHYKESQPLILHQAAQLPEMLLFFRSNP